MAHFLYLLYCVEAGIFLLRVPWLELWARATFVPVPILRRVFLSGHLRGGVSALGFLMLVVATIDLVGFCRAMREM